MNLQNEFIIINFGCTGFSLQCKGASCCGAQALEAVGSLVAARHEAVSSPTRDLTQDPCVRRFDS